MIKVSTSGRRGKYSNSKVGKFYPKNPLKYDGSELPIYKSNLERLCMSYLDRNPNILKWAYEKLAIQYLDTSEIPPVKRKYYIDFIVLAKCADGKIKLIWIEVKDSRETVLKESASPRDRKLYTKNIAKWTTATKMAKLHNAEFKVLTEKQLH